MKLNAWKLAVYYLYKYYLYSIQMAWHEIIIKLNITIQYIHVKYVLEKTTNNTDSLIDWVTGFEWLTGEYLFLYDWWLEVLIVFGVNLQMKI